MDYNATQRVDCDAVFDDSTSSESDNEDGPVATLVVQPEQDKASMSFDIFKGINVVGRQNSAECRICIPLAGVSRRHAIIEVDSDTHMIYDLGSLNKTKKGKLVLKPQIRYEMSDNEVLSFGDVVCRYSKLVPLKKDVNEMASLKKTWSEDNNNIPEENLKKKRDSSNILAEGFELRSDSEFSSDDEVVPSTYPSSDQKKKQKDICVPETPEDSCVTGRTNNTAFNLGGHHSDTDIESLKDSCEASKKNANAQLKKTISNLEVYHLDPDTDVDDKSQLAEMETVEYKWGEEDLEAGIVDGPPVIMRDKGESSLKAIAKKNLNGIPDSTDDESWLGIETQPYVTKATSGQGGKSDGSRRPASSSLSKISNGGLETNFPEDLATQDWANLATQPYITDGVDPEQLPCEPEGIDQNAATADDEPRINARATDNSKVIGNCKNGEKNSRIDAELADESDFVSPNTDDDLRGLKKKVGEVLTSAALLSSEETCEDQSDNDKVTKTVKSSSPCIDIFQERSDRTDAATTSSTSTNDLKNLKESAGLNRETTSVENKKLSPTNPVNLRSSEVSAQSPREAACTIQQSKKSPTEDPIQEELTVKNVEKGPKGRSTSKKKVRLAVDDEGASGKETSSGRHLSDARRGLVLQSEKVLSEADVSTNGASSPVKKSGKPTRRDTLRKRGQENHKDKQPGVSLEPCGAEGSHGASDDGTAVQKREDQPTTSATEHQEGASGLTPGLDDSEHLAGHAGKNSDIVSPILGSRKSLRISRQTRPTVANKEVPGDKADPNKNSKPVASRRLLTRKVLDQIDDDDDDDDELDDFIPSSKRQDTERTPRSSSKKLKEPIKETPSKKLKQPIKETPSKNLKEPVKESPQDPGTPSKKLKEPIKETPSKKLKELVKESPQDSGTPSDASGDTALQRKKYPKRKRAGSILEDTDDLEQAPKQLMKRSSARNTTVTRSLGTQSTREPKLSLPTDKNQDGEAVVEKSPPAAKTRDKMKDVRGSVPIASPVKDDASGVHLTIRLSKVTDVVSAKPSEEQVQTKQKRKAAQPEQVKKSRSSTSDVGSDPNSSERSNVVTTPRSRNASVSNRSSTWLTPSPGSAQKSAKPENLTTPAKQMRRSAANQNSNTPTPRRTKSDTPRIMFTGMSDTNLEKIVKDLNGSLVESVFDCTHLITDKVRRTWKFLCSVARGCRIVSPLWIERSNLNKEFLDSAKFEIKDPAAEKEYKFSLRKSLEKAAKAPLLKGYQIHVTKSVKPPPEDMRTIIECAGGKFLSRMPCSGEKKIIVSCEEDQAARDKARKNIPVVNAEFILTGILRQEIDIDGHRC